MWLQGLPNPTNEFPIWTCFFILPKWWVFKISKIEIWTPWSHIQSCGISMLINSQKNHVLYSVRQKWPNYEPKYSILVVFSIIRFTVLLHSPATLCSAVCHNRKYLPILVEKRPTFFKLSVRF